jgi:hypothetical protein
MKEQTKRRLAMVLFAFCLLAPFGASAMKWKVIWMPNPGIFPPSIPIILIQ